jgi:hypothetical protein
MNEVNATNGFSAIFPAFELTIPGQSKTDLIIFTRPAAI